MRLISTVVVMLFAMLPPAYAQSQSWQEYRPKDAGFRVEMPGKPDLKTEERNGKPTYSATVGVEKSVAGEDLVFLIKYQESNKTPGPETEELLDSVVKAMTEGGKLLNDKKETLGRFPARRFSFEDADKDTFEIRGVITDNYFIQALFIGPPAIRWAKDF
jgi:hypothetical protein